MTGDAADLRALFDRAISVAPADRAAFLDRACAGNLDLRRALERLLAAHDRGGSVFDTEQPLDTSASAKVTVPEAGPLNNVNR